MEMIVGNVLFSANDVTGNDVGGKDLLKYVDIWRCCS